MLRLGLRREPRRVGRHEGERVFRVAAVFRQVEVHAADQVPRGIQPGEVVLQAGLGGFEPGGERLRRLLPQRQQHVRGHILGPRHHRRAQQQRGKLGLVRLRNDRQGRCGGGVRACGMQAHRGDVARGVLAPPDEGGGQGLPGLARGEPHQAVAGIECERLGQADGYLGVDLRRVVLVFHDQASVRGEA